MANQRRSRTLDLGVILLLNELYGIGLRTIPPVTLSTIVGQILLFVGAINVPWDKFDVCISGRKVWFMRDWSSFFISTFEHGDDMHLYYNMISFLFKGRNLERKYGSPNFFILLTILCILTPAFYVLLAVLGAKVLDEPRILSSCAIGFSGVIFALKFITTVEEQGYSYIYGFQVPVRYSAWIELIAIHVLVPNSSFMGHLAGVLAGVLYMKTPFGRLIDSFITSITGEPMVHATNGFTYPDDESSSSGYRSGPRHQSYGFQSHSYGFRDNSYGFRNDNYGFRDNDYGFRYRQRW